VQAVGFSGVVVPGDQAVVEQDDALYVGTGAYGYAYLFGELEARPAVGDYGQVVAEYVGDCFLVPVVVHQG
jgi:hypothetical protein